MGLGPPDMPEIKMPPPPPPPAPMDQPDVVEPELLGAPKILPFKSFKFLSTSSKTI